MRIFVGIKIEASLAESFLAYVRGLEQTPAKILHPDDIHLTLLPPWDTDEVMTAEQTLKNALVGQKPIRLALHHLGYGPNPESPRFVWVDCGLSPELVDLQRRVAAAFDIRNERPFHPHITVARLHENGVTIQRVHPLDVELKSTLTIDSVELFASVYEEGHRYRVLQSTSLQ